jgi:hypothetical protein
VPAVALRTSAARRLAGGWGVCQSAVDSVKDFRGSSQDIDIGNAQYTVAATLKPSRALSIAVHLFLAEVLRAVLLHDQLRRGTEEIGDVWPDGMLTAEAKAR